ncbi:RNase A-like domain-containing protein [Burkholderia latens]|uniref:RNase A-like domain-containing protein n=1 Tax=Burkholderia latens TaxID=488446 RepID=UPI003132BE4F
MLAGTAQLRSPAIILLHHAAYLPPMLFNGFQSPVASYGTCVDVTPAVSVFPSAGRYVAEALLVLVGAHLRAANRIDAGTGASPAFGRKRKRSTDADVGAGWLRYVRVAFIYRLWRFDPPTSRVGSWIRAVLANLKKYPFSQRISIISFIFISIREKAMREDHDGEVRIVLSAAQLAAVLGHQTISPGEMSSNRLWGGLQVVGGVLEMVGAAALCVAPEPTGLTKLGCVAFGVHGADTAAAGLKQVWTGQDTSALLQQGVTKLAVAANAPPEMADHVGISLDLAVPFGLAGAVKAIRASSITAGRINLMQHEATAANPRLGGHTISKHVGKTEAQLRERLKQEPHRDVVSSFHNMRTAEFAISAVIRIEAARIDLWAKSTRRHIPLTLIRHVSGDIGYGIYRNNEITKYWSNLIR